MTRIRPNAFVLWLLGIISVGAVAATPAAAVSVGYSVSINDPIFNSTSGDENVPDFQIENTSDASTGVNLSAFTLTIGEDGFIYDFVRTESAFIDDSADLTPTLLAPERDNDQVGTEFLAYEFTGFDPGDIFRFEVDIDPDVGNVIVDFREILFPTAVLTVEFDNGFVLTEVLNPADITATGYNFSQSRVIPLPAGLPLYLGALVVGGLIVRRRGRRT